MSRTYAPVSDTEVETMLCGSFRGISLKVLPSQLCFAVFPEFIVMPFALFQCVSLCLEKFEVLSRLESRRKCIFILFNNNKNKQNCSISLDKN